MINTKKENYKVDERVHTSDEASMDFCDSLDKNHFCDKLDKIGFLLNDYMIMITIFHIFVIVNVYVLLVINYLNLNQRINILLYFIRDIS